MRETWVRSLSWEDPLEKGKATHSSILAWRIPGTIQSTWSQRVRHNWMTFTSLVVFLTWFILFETLWVSCTWVAISYVREVSNYNLLKYSLISIFFFFFWGPCNLYACVFNVVPEVSVTVLISFHFFFVYSAAAAKSLQSCLTLCYPRDCSPPGSPFPGILQARTLEWVAISFSNASVISTILSCSLVTCSFASVILLLVR